MRLSLLVLLVELRTRKLLLCHLVRIKSCMRFFSVLFVVLFRCDICVLTYFYFTQVSSRVLYFLRQLLVENSVLKDQENTGKMYAGVSRLIKKYLLTDVD